MTAGPDIPLEQLGPLVQQARLRRALTEQGLANLLGVSRPTVSNWERGKTLPALDMIRPLASALEISWRKLAKAREADLQQKRRIRLLGVAAVATVK